MRPDPNIGRGSSQPPPEDRKRIAIESALKDWPSAISG